MKQSQPPPPKRSLRNQVLEGSGRQSNKVLLMWPGVGGAHEGNITKRAVGVLCWWSAQGDNLTDSTAEVVSVVVDGANLIPFMADPK